MTEDSTHIVSKRDLSASGNDGLVFPRERCRCASFIYGYEKVGSELLDLYVSHRYHPPFLGADSASLPWLFSLYCHRGPIQPGTRGQHLD